MGRIALPPFLSTQLLERWKNTLSGPIPVEINKDSRATSAAVVAGTLLRAGLYLKGTVKEDKGSSPTLIF